MEGLKPLSHYWKPTKGWGKVPHCLYDMEFERKAHVIAVYAFLQRRINNKTGQCNPSLSDMARHTGMSSRQVTRTLGTLERKRVIKVSRTLGQGNRYQLLPPREWDWAERLSVNRVSTNSQGSIDP